MLNWFIEIKFKDLSENIYWFPFYIEAFTKQDAEAYTKRHTTGLKEKYDILEVYIEQVIEGLYSVLIKEYRNQAFSGKPLYIDIKRYVLVRENDLIDTNPEIPFNETLILETLIHGKAKAEYYKTNRFPIQKISRSLEKTETFNEILILHIFAK
ncbi:hypothetical protein [Leptospira sp. GIMC2001]|uniref:hypothetical protein n=1 Tax=Leptospira sp. GIMC2001 TaxID=1513297 RepID=UPI002349AB51|nr:hypothetical protein [Leptospira sp. GIMC2001]WCL50660.1 hypothetical protein O4O04_07580 [Leptospira sp. GIMC2001]